MHIQNRWLVAQFSLIVLVVSSDGLACPEYLKKLPSPTVEAYGMTSCQLHDRYADLKQKFAKHGVDAERVRLIRGPRFIRLTDYLGEKGKKAKFDPWRVYDPAPDTWQQWEKAESVIKAASDSNYAAAGLQDGPRAIDDEFLKKVHNTALKGLPRETFQFRTYSKVGPQVAKEFAVPLASARAICYGSTEPQKIADWQFLRCFEDMSETERKLVELRKYDKLPPVPEYHFPKEVNGQRMSFACGMYTYTPPAKIPGAVKDWQDKINKEIAGWYQGKTFQDPVATAAQAERWMVAIHPFEDGNGRTSRFMMDYLPHSLGLPAPVLVDMDSDLYADDRAWSTEVARGMITTIQFLDYCLKEIEGGYKKNPYCNATSEAP